MSSETKKLTTNELHSAYLVALNSGDIDSVMELFADNATFQTYEDEILVGKANIKDYLESKIDEGIQVVSETTILSLVTGIKLTEKITFAGNSLNCTGKYTVASGKITGYSWQPR